MHKLLTYPGRTDKGIHAFAIMDEKGYLEKTASAYHPTIAAYIHGAKRIPGMTQLLITALGAGEYWSFNTNGDFFAEDQLAHEGEDYGFKTFEYYAKLFKHHVNKPDSPSYGKVFLSVYNAMYHRVELIVGVNHADAPDVVEQMEMGNYPVFSMGCKIPFDICSKCGNKAPTRKQYCEHLRYQLGQLDFETNKPVFAYNIRPRFFDISMVIVPADRTAMTLKKVAYAVSPGGIITSSAELAEKHAFSFKEAEIEKEIPVVGAPSSGTTIDKAKAEDLAKSIMQVRASEPTIPSATLDRMLDKSGFPEVVSTMAASLILPKPQEFQRLFLVSRGLRELADKLEKLNVCFDPMMAPESLSDTHYSELGLNPQHVRSNVADELAPFFDSRSYAAPMLNRRLIVMVKQAEQLTEQERAIPPVFVNRNERNLGSDLIPILGFGAALYAALNMSIGEHAFSSLSQLVLKNPRFALAAGLGAATAVRSESMRDQTIGRYVSTPDLPNDGSQVYDRIQRMREKPYVKIGAQSSIPVSDHSLAERLLIGVPAAYAASGILQTHKNQTPQDEAGRISRFIRENPDVVNGALVADAVLGKNDSGTKKAAALPQLSMSKTALFKAAGIVMDSDSGYPSSASGSSDPLWYTTSDVANLPSRIASCLLDKSAIKLGSHLSKVRRSRGV